MLEVTSIRIGFMIPCTATVCNLVTRPTFGPLTQAIGPVDSDKLLSQAGIHVNASSTSSL
eukprot:998951-Rhodomonas_salina.2